MSVKISGNYEISGNGDIDAIFDFDENVQFVDKTIGEGDYYTGGAHVYLQGYICEPSGSCDGGPGPWKGMSFTSRIIQSELDATTYYSNRDYEIVRNLDSSDLNILQTSSLGLEFYIGVPGSDPDDHSNTSKVYYAVGSSCQNCSSSEYETWDVIVANAAQIGESVSDSPYWNLIQFDKSQIANVGDSVSYYTNYSTDYWSSTEGSMLSNIKMVNGIPFMMVSNQGEYNHDIEEYDQYTTLETFRLTIERRAVDKLAFIFRWICIKDVDD